MWRAPLRRPPGLKAGRCALEEVVLGVAVEQRGDAEAALSGRVGRVADDDQPFFAVGQVQEGVERVDWGSATGRAC